MILAKFEFVVKGNTMLRAFVVANDSLLADEIVKNIGPQAHLRVLRIAEHEPGGACETTRENCLALIIVDAGSEVAG